MKKDVTYAKVQLGNANKALHVLGSRAFPDWSATQSAMEEA